MPTIQVIGVKFSQIAVAASPPLLTDQLIGLKNGATDSRWSLAQIKTTIGQGMAANNNDYVAVPASTSNQILGTTGAVGDYLATILVIPATTTPGAITVKDGSGGTPMTVFAGGAASINDLRPFNLALGLPSKLVGWYITTGANVSVVAAGTFT